MEDNGVQRLLEKNSEELVNLLKQGTYIVMDDYMLTTSTKMSRELIDSITENSKKFPSFSMEYETEVLETNQEYRIIQLKSQLKHCKNPLQKLNIERELNRLYKNKER